MAYQVLARKWRPQKFDDVIGQQAVTRTLRNALASGRIAQAFVFAGQRGSGKTTTARILARALNCVPKDQRQALELHYLKGLSVAEAAKFMNRSRPAIVGLLFRGRYACGYHHSPEQDVQPGAERRAHHELARVERWCFTSPHRGEV